MSKTTHEVKVPIGERHKLWRKDEPSKERTTKPRVIVILKGGLVQEVLCDKAVELIVVDQDTEGMIDIIDIEGEEAFIQEPWAAMDAERVNAIYMEIKDQDESCGHKTFEDCMYCSECGVCSESLDDDDICSDCR